MTSYPLSELADFLDPPPPRDETKPHVSDLVHIAMMEKERGELPWEIMALGRIWEYVVRGDVKRRCRKEGLAATGPAVLERDGILGSLDGTVYGRVGVDQPMRPKAVVEAKLRFSPRVSDKGDIFDPKNYRRYAIQTKAYCHMFEVDEVWIPILYIGSRPPSAEYVWHRIQWSPVELLENWGMLLNCVSDWEEKR